MPRRRFVFASLALLVAGALLTSGCDRLASLAASPETADTTRAPGVPPPDVGLVTVTTARSVDAAVQQLRSALQSGPASLVTEIDHAQNAASAGDTLRPTRLLMFGNPALGTPLMQRVRSTGIDLPQKILVWQSLAGDSTRITYNAPSYLSARHDLRGGGATLGQMSRALADLAEQAAGRAPDTTAFSAGAIPAAGGLAVTVSDFGPGETFRRFQGAVQSSAGLSVMASVDHAQNASATGDSLPPTRLLVFGNPALGTPLMQRAPTIGIDLPQKALVYESNEGTTFLAYNRPAYLARRHALTDTTGLGRAAQALDRLVFEATAGEAERREVEEARRDSTGVSF